MDIKDLIFQLSEKIEDGETKELFLETIKELGEEVSVDDVLSLYENIGNANNELDSNSAGKAEKESGLSGSEGSPDPLHKKFNNDAKTGQEASHNTDLKQAVEDGSSDSTLDSYAKKLNDGAKSKIKALKSNDKALPEELETPTFGTDIAAIFEGIELSEDFKEKAQLIFETAIQTKITEHIDYLTEAVAEHMEQLDEEVAGIISEELELFKEEKNEQLEKYLEYIVEEFIEKNEVALESSIKVEIAESMFEGFKSLLAEHNVDVSAEKIDLVDQVVAENEEIVESYNQEVEKNIKLIAEIKQLKKEKLIKDLTEELSDVEAEKFGKLLEGVEFTDEESFINKVTILSEAYTPSTQKKAVPSQKLTEDFYTQEDETEVTEINSDVKRVLAGLDRFSK